jgi:hypothetical protein
MSWLGALEAIPRSAIVGEGAGLTEIVPTGGLDGGTEGSLADLTDKRKSILIQVFIFLRMYFIVLFAIIDIMTHEPQLLSLLLSLKFLVELPTAFVVRTIMDENTRVTEVAPP